MGKNGININIGWKDLVRRSDTGSPTEKLKVPMSRI
jgi:hypothetical protein